MTLGEKIRDLRQESGESQTELAIALGYRNYHTIVKMEHDKMPLSEVTLERIALHYGKPAGYFKTAYILTERQRLRRKVNEYCAERKRNFKPCKECKGYGTALCESDNFFRRNIDEIRTAVEELTSET